MVAVARWVDPVNGDSANAGLSRDDAYADIADVQGEDPATASDDLTIHLVGNNLDTKETTVTWDSGLSASTITYQIEDGPFYHEKTTGYGSGLAMHKGTITGNRATGETGPRFLHHTNTTSTAPVGVNLDPDSGETITIEDSAGLVVDHQYSGGSPQAAVSIDGPGTTYVANGIIVSGAPTVGWYATWGAGSPTATLHNCDVEGSGGAGFDRGAGSMTCKNCKSFGNTGDDFGSSVTTTTCASSDATGDTGLINLTAADEIQDATPVHWYEFNLKASSTLEGAGTDLDSDANLPVTVDIMGVARHATAPDVGAFEYSTVPCFVEGGELVNSTSATSGSNTVALTLPNNVPNGYLIVDAVFENDTEGQRMSAVQYNSVNMTEGPSARYNPGNSGDATCQIFYLDSPSDGASHDVTWTNAAGGQDIIVRWRLYAHCTTVGEYTGFAGSLGVGSFMVSNNATTETSDAFVIWTGGTDRANIWLTANANNNPRGHSATSARSSTAAQATMNGDRFVSAASTVDWGFGPDVAETGAAVALVLSGDFTPTTNIRRRGHGCISSSSTAAFDDWIAVSMQSDVDCLVIVAGYEQDTSQDVTALTVGAAMTEQYDETGGHAGSGDPRMNVYTLLNPTTGVQTVAPTLGDSGRDLGLYYYTYSNVDSIGTNKDSDGATGTTATSCTISHDADSMILGLGVGDSPVGSSDTASVTGTLVDFTGGIGNGAGVGVVFLEDFKASSGSASMGYAYTASRNRILVMLELKAAGAPGGGSVPVFMKHYKRLRAA